MTLPENIPDTTAGFGSIPVVVPTSTAPPAVPAKVERERPKLLAPNKTKVWNIDFSRVDMEQTLQFADNIVQRGEPEYFITANLNYAMLTDEDPRLQPVNEAAAAIVADGNPIVWRSRLGSTPLPGRVAGSDLITALAELASIRGYRPFFLGGEPGVAQGAADALMRQYPTLEVAGCYAPPFRELSEQEHAQLLARIQEARTDILFVAFGQPKGELWIYENYQQLGVPLSIQLGASFDFLAGTAKRAPRIWQRFACEWLHRALQQPFRLLPRYGKNLQFMCSILFRELLGRPQSECKEER